MEGLQLESLAFDTIADNSPAPDDQAGCRLLRVLSLGDSASHLVEGVASLHDWSSSPD
jgi:hypothetical protein